MKRLVPRSVFANGFGLRLGALGFLLLSALPAGADPMPRSTLKGGLHYLHEAIKAERGADSRDHTFASVLDYKDRSLEQGYEENLSASAFLGQRQLAGRNSPLYLHSLLAEWGPQKSPVEGHLFSGGWDYSTPGMGNQPQGSFYGYEGLDFSSRPQNFMNLGWQQKLVSSQRWRHEWGLTGRHGYARHRRTEFQLNAKHRYQVSQIDEAYVETKAWHQQSAEYDDRFKGVSIQGGFRQNMTETLYWQASGGGAVYSYQDTNARPIAEASMQYQRGHNKLRFEGGRKLARYRDNQLLHIRDEALVEGRYRPEIQFEFFGIWRFGQEVDTDLPNFLDFRVKRFELGGSWHQGTFRADLERYTRQLWLLVAHEDYQDSFEKSSLVSLHLGWDQYF